MNWAGYTYIILLAMGLGVDLALHGKEKEVKRLTERGFWKRVFNR